MSNSAKEMTDCVTALTTLVAALHHLMDQHPETKERLLPATIRLSEALPCVSTFLSIDLVEINRRLTDVERRLSLLEADVAQLKSDVAQLKSDVGQLKSDVAQLKSDVAQLKSYVADLKVDVGQLKKDMVDVKVAIAKIDERMDGLHQTFATKEDLHKLTWRMYGFATGLVAVVYFIARYVH